MTLIEDEITAVDENILTNYIENSEILFRGRDVFAMTIQEVSIILEDIHMEKTQMENLRKIRIFLI